LRVSSKKKLASCVHVSDDMIRIAAIALLALALAGCQHAPPSHAKIAHFKADPSFIPTGTAGKLCYGVENATKLDLNPPVEHLLPASERCIDITPKQTTTYTLTAWGEDGGQDKKSFEVRVGPPLPRLSDLVASSTEVKRGASVEVCFKVENAKTVRARPGKLNRRTNCLVDFPRKTTTYTVTALGPDSEEDHGTVTVKVVR
jgi:hypothetical protein